MKKITFLLFLLPIFFRLSSPVRGEGTAVAGQSALPQKRLFQSEIDPRTEKLRLFLEEQNSPLAPYASSFIHAADKYQLEEFGLTYLVPAITGLESSFGRFYLQNSYNAYGWAGGYYRFSSWEESIEHVTRVLKEKYLDRGADTISKIGPIYAESPTWAQRVNYFLNKIKNFSSPSQKIAFTL